MRPYSFGSSGRRLSSTALNASVLQFALRARIFGGRARLFSPGDRIGPPDSRRRPPRARQHRLCLASSGNGSLRPISEMEAAAEENSGGGFPNRPVMATRPTGTPKEKLPPLPRPYSTQKYEGLDESRGSPVLMFQADSAYQALHNRRQANNPSARLASLTRTALAQSPEDSLHCARSPVVALKP